MEEESAFAQHSKNRPQVRIFIPMKFFNDKRYNISLTIEGIH